MFDPRPYAKAVVAFVVPGAVVIGQSVMESSPGGERITAAEWATALVACIVTAGSVYAVPNRDPEGAHQDESAPPEPEVIPGTTLPDLHDARHDIATEDEGA